jgi:cbb3-type cytochrome c oxidase subunit I
MRKLWEMTARPNSTAVAFMVAGSIWFVIGTLYGLLSAIHLAAPEFFNNIPFLVFGRTRPIHVNTVLYGFVTSTLIGCGFYYVPALLRTPLWSERLGWFTFLMWNVAVLSGPFTFSFGLSQGREYTEYLWTFDLILMLAVLAGVVNLVMTIARRNENTLYVSVWYMAGAFLWTAGMYPIGNVMWHPATGAMPGLVDSLFLWFYGHNLPGLLLTPLAVGAAYYVIPRITRTPLYSHVLSLVGFWTLVALYSHIGGHHLVQSPIPNWLKVISTIDSVAMILPVFTVLANIWMTARGQGGKVLADPAGRFVMAGTFWYLLTCIQGPVQSIPAIQRVTHFNNWTIGHSHVAVLGFAGYIALGALWHIVPLATGRRVYSKGLINIQFGLLTFGLTGFFAVLTIAGLIQGTAWNNGETVYRVLPQISVYMLLRAALGISIIGAAGVGLANLILTVTKGTRTRAETQEEPQS